MKDRSDCETWSAEDTLCATKLRTARYQDWRPQHGVPVRISVGAPKFWRGRKLVDGRVAAPWGLIESAGKAALSIDERRERYEQRLDEKGDEVVALLARIAVEHPGEQLCLCCFEDVHAGQECHRRWLAEWLEDRFGIDVPELTDDTPPRLFGLDG
jgi:hypothetical protein